MNANDPRRQRLRRAVAMMAIAASCAARAQGDAGAVPPDAAAAPGWPDADIVDQLLRRETRAALAEHAHRRGAPPDPPARTESRAAAQAQPDRIDLAAIYGIGKRLDVEVLVNGQRLRYRHGRKWPEESPDGEGAYALRGIHGSCILLDSPGGNRRACLSRGD
ncbi:hypothetical protein [Bordetella sp. H567]|uniref:hypothetical protein n=1 Tax=Bordetella sp. H567 TaxID=1697043 RepID=UPI00083133F9|nr:hypothetical protein [Bordetella sp. H567]